VSANVREAILAMSPNGKGYWINVLDKLNLLRQAVGQAKLPSVVSWAENFLNNSDKKLVIYAHHRNVVATLTTKLQQYGVLWITGDVDAHRRDDRACAFQHDHVNHVMIISMAGGVGQDLFGIGGVNASNILFAELEWRPGDFEQAWGRLDREGQTLPVNAWILQARRTIDTYITRTVERKEAVIDAAVGGVPAIFREIIEDWKVN